MHLINVFIVYLLCISVKLTIQNESVISFKPKSLSIVIGENKSVDIQLYKTNVTLPIVIEFLYDGNATNTGHYIDSIPNVTFTNHSTDPLHEIIHIFGHRRGHLTLTAQSSQLYIPSLTDFLLIDIARSNILSIFIQIVGWIYFVAWSISFYPQIILNFQRRSVVGLNFDFLALNILGHSCYSVFNVVLYTSSKVQQQYFVHHPHGVLPVLLNDVIFSCHAVFACVVTIIQCLFFERGGQRVSIVATLLGAIGIIFLFIATMVSISNHITTLTLLYFFSYVKLAITIIKYCPQAWMNYKRKSTEGWSIGNILLDFTGGLFSLLQMFLLSTNYDDWSSIFGSPTKLGLGLFSIIFDILFIVQHYILYRTNNHNHNRINLQKETSDEKSPILSRRIV